MSGDHESESSSFADLLYQLGRRMDEQLLRARLERSLEGPSSGAEPLDYEFISEFPAALSTLSEPELKSAFVEAARRGDAATLESVERQWRRKLFSAGLAGASDAEVVRWLLEGGAEVSVASLQSAATRGDAEGVELQLSSRKFSASELLSLLDARDAQGRTAEDLAANFKTREALRGRRVLALAAEAQEHYKQGAYERSAAFYSLALEFCAQDEDANRAKLLYNLARALYRQGQYVQAAEYCEASIRLDPSYLNSYRCRAQCYVGLLDVERARADLEVCGEHMRYRQLVENLQDLHSLLGLSRGNSSTEAEIRAAFKEAARIWHPDKNAGASDAVRTRCANHFPRIQEAYTVLTARTTTTSPWPKPTWSFPTTEVQRMLASPEDGNWTNPETLLDEKENRRASFSRASDAAGARMSVSGEDRY